MLDCIASGKHPIPFQSFSDLIELFYSYKNLIKDIDFSQGESRVFTASKREKVDSSEISDKRAVRLIQTLWLMHMMFSVLGKSIVEDDSLVEGSFNFLGVTTWVGVYD